MSIKTWMIKYRCYLETPQYSMHSYLTLPKFLTAISPWVIPFSTRPWWYCNSALPHNAMPVTASLRRSVYGYWNRRREYTGWMCCLLSSIKYSQCSQWNHCIVWIQYEYNASGAGSGVVGGFRAIVDYLVRITINTVENHLHVCKRMDEGYSPPTPHMPRPRGICIHLYNTV